LLTERQQYINNQLVDYIKDLDIPPSKYKEAMDRFNSLKGHLEDGDYPNTNIPPDVYMQGSFRLGTVIRPYKEGKDADYDLDIVCRLKQEKDSTEPENLKNDVGEEVKAYARENSMRNPKEKRRCWVLEYAADSNGIGFHMDVLSCVHDQELAEYISRENPTLEQYANTTIAITNRDDDVKPPQYDWRSGNPHGYAKWFLDINRPGFVIFEKEQRQILYENNKSIYLRDKDVPNELIRTPLQQTIQILKRHRDIHFAGHKWEKYKPISMIITTLAARLYQGNADRLKTVYSAFDYIVKQLIAHASLLEPMQFLGEDVAKLKLIQRVGNKWYIPNPVNPHNLGDPEDKGENFADRWDEDNQAGAKAFFDWIRNLKDTFEHIFQKASLEEIPNILEENLKATKTKLKSQQLNTGGKLTTVVSGASTLSRFDVAHREPPRWPIENYYNVTIDGQATRNGFRTLTSRNGFNNIGKKYSLRFEAKTNVPEPYSVYWQVVNTGHEAESIGQLRGQIFAGSNVRTESTEYTGFHWIECFIVKNSVCVARSGEFVVRIQ